mmetsp:Transcript_8184/g.19366  ORF Transcript_8184/g.19366 Transcript_8184/m.19366 type:complete len:215 (+) Transcript_8184:584-1228(+)
MAIPSPRPRIQPAKLSSPSRAQADGETWMKGVWEVEGMELEAMRLAVLTVSPKIEYRGLWRPMILAVNGPALTPILRKVGAPSGRRTGWTAASISRASARQPRTWHPGSVLKTSTKLLNDSTLVTALRSRRHASTRSNTALTHAIAAPAPCRSTNSSYSTKYMNSTVPSWTSSATTCSPLRKRRERAGGARAATRTSSTSTCRRVRSNSARALF